ncbi:uncharacterized protein LOC129900130 [Solanum dulcamara]|uniref:uncharacterized protein LOC129900130 n=1 Tax=Solanum dulcamara TaxID=45834 RepID=UPI0024861005|nr:uncharacterized protein LOC129900130 [Solanum dulcamara]
MANFSKERAFKPSAFRKLLPTYFSWKQNTVAAKAASISLSSFGTGSPFSFDPFSRKWNSKKKTKTKKRKPFPQDKSSNKHEAIGNEWLETGNCPIAKSYIAVNGVLPIVASTFQLPLGMKLKCPSAVVSVRAALARTVFVKTMRPQPLFSKMFVTGALGMTANIPLGIWREHTEKFSLSWFVAVLAAVPFIAMLRKSVAMPKTAMALTIATSILGQVIGSRAEKLRMKVRDSTVIESWRENFQQHPREVLQQLTVDETCINN